MSNKSSTRTGGIGFVGLLTIAFIILKLCKVISWSWVWVLSPIWIFASVLLLILGIGLLISFIDYKKTTKKENK